MADDDSELDVGAFDRLILQVFEEQEDRSGVLTYPLTSQRQALEFIKLLNRKGFPFRHMCDVIGEKPETFRSWRLGNGNTPVGLVMMKRINKTVQEAMNMPEADVDLEQVDMEADGFLDDIDSDGHENQEGLSSAESDDNKEPSLPNGEPDPVSDLLKPDAEAAASPSVSVSVADVIEPKETVELLQEDSKSSDKTDDLKAGPCDSATDETEQAAHAVNKALPEVTGQVTEESNAGKLNGEEQLPVALDEKQSAEAKTEELPISVQSSEEDGSNGGLKRTTDEKIDVVPEDSVSAPAADAPQEPGPNTSSIVKESVVPPVNATLEEKGARVESVSLVGNDAVTADTKKSSGDVTQSRDVSGTCTDVVDSSAASNRELHQASDNQSNSSNAGELPTAGNESSQVSQNSEQNDSKVDKVEESTEKCAVKEEPKFEYEPSSKQVSLLDRLAMLKDRAARRKSEDGDNKTTNSIVNSQSSADQEPAAQSVSTTSKPRGSEPVATACIPTTQPLTPGADPVTKPVDQSSATSQTKRISDTLKIKSVDAADNKTKDELKPTTTISTVVSEPRSAEAATQSHDAAPKTQSTPKVTDVVKSNEISSPVKCEGVLPAVRGSSASTAESKHRTLTDDAPSKDGGEVVSEAERSSLKTDAVVKGSALPTSKGSAAEESRTTINQKQVDNKKDSAAECKSKQSVSATKSNAPEDCNATAQTKSALIAEPKLDNKQVNAKKVDDAPKASTKEAVSTDSKENSAVLDQTKRTSDEPLTAKKIEKLSVKEEGLEKISSVPSSNEKPKKAIDEPQQQVIKREDVHPATGAVTTAQVEPDPAPAKSVPGAKVPHQAAGVSSVGKRVKTAGRRVELAFDSIFDGSVTDNYDSDLDIAGSTDKTYSLIDRVRKLKASPIEAPGYLYVFTDSPTVEGSAEFRGHESSLRFKVGASRFPGKRLQQAMCFNPDMKVVIVVSVKRRLEALRLVRQKLDQFKIPGTADWFACDDDLVASAVDDAVSEVK